MLVAHSTPSPLSAEQTQINQHQSHLAPSNLAQSRTATPTSENLLHASAKSLNVTPKSLPLDTVTLSPQALELAIKSPNSGDAQTRPAPSTLPNEGEKVEVYVEYKKAKMQYQFYSDMANIATGNNNGVSPAAAYYLSNNDDARAATVNVKAQQQQVTSMQTYVDTTKSLNELS
ncbi:hypothetical protein ACVBIO_16875 [Shewanella sp. 0m-8]